MQDLWKKFDEAELSHSSIHHLLAINSLRQQQGYARLVDISNHLNISRASVSVTIGKLRNKGFVEEDHNRFVNLSGKGSEIVHSVLTRRRVMQEFFRSVLQLPENVSELNACKIEHLLDEEAGEKLARFIDFYRSDASETSNFRRGLKKYLEAGAPA